MQVRAIFWDWWFWIFSIPSLQSFHDFKKLILIEKLTKTTCFVFQNHSLTRASKLSLLFDQSCSFIFLTTIGITLPTDFALINICFVTFATFTSSFSFQLFRGSKIFQKTHFKNYNLITEIINVEGVKVSFYKFFIFSQDYLNGRAETPNWRLNKSIFSDPAALWFSLR